MGSAKILSKAQSGQRSDAWRSACINSAWRGGWGMNWSVYPRSGPPGFEFWLFHLVFMWPQASYWTSLLGLPHLPMSRTACGPGEGRNMVGAGTGLNLLSEVGDLGCRSGSECRPVNASYIQTTEQMNLMHQTQRAYTNRVFSFQVLTPAGGCWSSFCRKGWLNNGLWGRKSHQTTGWAPASAYFFSGGEKMSTMQIILWRRIVCGEIWVCKKKKISKPQSSLPKNTE